jgi:hypothetical protein
MNSDSAHEQCCVNSDSDSERRQYSHAQQQLTLARDGLQEEIDRAASALCSETLEGEK